MLQLGIYNQPNGTLILDCTHIASGVTISTNQHGFQALEATIPLPFAYALLLYATPGAFYVCLSNGGQVVWEGRLEDPSLWVSEDGAGLKIGALGYQRAVSDVLYTALWSNTATGAWKADSAPGGSTTSRYTTGTNNSIAIILQKDAVYANNAESCIIRYLQPYGSINKVVRTSFTYEVVLPTGWIARLVCGNEGYTSLSVAWSITGNGGLQTGSIAGLSIPARDFVYWEAYNATGASYAFTGETGTAYATLAPILVQGGSSGSFSASYIVQGLIAYVSTLNPTHLSPSVALVQGTANDLPNEVYADQRIGDILNRLVDLGDDPTTIFEWAVWEQRILAFRTRGSAGRAWVVDAATITLQRSLDQLANSVYATYQDPNGRTLRTGANTNGGSVAQYNVTRQRQIRVDTNDPNAAITQRDVALLDTKDASPRAEITFDRVYTISGAMIPKWWVRAGDTITIRNLPPTGTAGLDKLRTFRVTRTEYDMDSDTLKVEPDVPLPTLDVLVARLKAA